MARLLIATNNAHKVAEFRRLLAGTGVDLTTPAELGLDLDVEETGETFKENARLKARYYSRFVPHLTIAEDSGLEIEALDGAPGVRSARFNGTTYPEKFEALYARLRDRREIASPARFVCAVAVVERRRVVFEASGTLEGRIAETPAGSGGFGYDPIFFYPPFGCTLAEVSPDRKAAISHRGAAFRHVRAFLESRLGG